MNSQSVPVHSPFKLIAEYTPNARKTLPTVTAAPERSKVSAQVSLPDMRDRRWADNLECTLNIIADTLAQHGH